MVGGKEQKAERKGKKGKMGKKKTKPLHISHLSLDFPHLLNGADKDVFS